ncbi:TonB-dependent receptor domain-containing protein [Sphingosinicella terrae]|uniref:TonB-dependent receptor domain-containing protein n=1 Tax=Sphingosinicella terrae TaxID=2172047 RepID=UPI002547812B|nr:TonB-dependent receptor [Sphingosinicella terrae]
MRTKTRFTSNLLATTIFCGAVSVAAPAWAQEEDTLPQSGPVEATSQETAQQGEQAIVITGSRIPQPNLTATSPVTVLNSQEVRLQGTTRTEDLINSLPQSFGEQGGNLANGATGTATVNLRGLGSKRTLVLINGRRLVPGDPTVPVPDINVIPTSIVERVDVLTGGASSVYGSDAVAGVVNFVMDTDFEGFRLDAQYSFYQHDNDDSRDLNQALDRRGFGYPTGSVADGGTFDISVAMGAGFDDGRGHVVAYAGYRKIDPVLQGRRDYSACASQARQPTAANPTVLDCGGSATSANGTIFNWASDTLQIGPNRTLIPGFTPYNFAPTNYFQRPDERYTLGAFANYEISPALQPYLEVMFMDDRTRAQIAASGNFGNTLSLNCDNPLLSAQQLAIICAPENLVTTVNETGFPLVEEGEAPQDFIDPTTGAVYNRGFAQFLRRNVEGGGRVADLQHTNYRIVGGMRGDLDDVWSYDAYYSFAQTNYALTYENDFSVTRLTRALDVVTDPATGNAVCRTRLAGTDLACVPYDIFATGQVTPEALAYLQTPGFQRGTNQQTVASASLTGNLGQWGVQLPWASDGLGIALGLEYRKESLDLQTDQAFQLLPSSDLAGQGAPTLPVNGSYDVREAFAEVRIPIVEDSFIYNFSIEAGYRYSDYDLGTRSVSTDTYKVGIDLSPIRDIRFRGTYNRAVRAPNIQELFAPQVVVLNGNGDPCAGSDPDFSLAQCQAQGVTAAQYGGIAGNPAGQYNGLIGGSQDLTPEVADTWTVGVVFQPSFLPRFALTVDWFDIQIDNAIQQIGQDTILDVCGATLDPEFCGLINRDPTGSLWRTAEGYVEDRVRNIGGFSTRGIDVSASYQHEIGSFGSLSFNMNGTWLDRLEFDTGISPVYDCAGLYGLVCLTPSPEWRHKARLTWSHPDGYGLSFQWRYFGGVTLDRASDDPELQGAFSPVNERISSQSYFDLVLTSRVGDNFNFRLGVNNLLDKAPPIIGANGSSAVINACTGVFCSGNTFPNVYDALGRYIFAGVTLDF